jgi:FkbM family methyltransferase
LAKGRSYRFSTYGEIVKIIYANQPLNYFGKGFEYKTIDKFISLLKKGDVVIDVGANIGMYSLLAAELVGEEGKVYSFEPVSATFNALNENLQLNHVSVAKTHKIALSNGNGSARISIPESVGRGDFSDAFNSLNLDENGKGGEVVQTMTLDTFVTEHQIDSIDFVKVDIEGAELLFFKGCHDVLSRIRPKYIIFEAYEEFCSRFDYTIADMIVLLNSYGYSLENYDEWQWIGVYKEGSNISNVKS